MTDKKISDLTAAGTVNDADIFPMVQSGDTKHATIALMKAAVAPSLATESTAGIIEIANQAEAESQTNDDKAMTALKVQQFLDVGTVIDGATGGNQGDGTINAKGLFVNGEEVAGGAAGMELISSSTPTGVATVTFSSIPQTYRGLYLIVEAVSATGTGYLLIQCWTNSYVDQLTPQGFTVAGTTVASITGSSVCGVPVTSTAGNTTSASFKIFGYQGVSVTGGSTMYPRSYQASYLAQSGSTVYAISGGLNTIGSLDTGIDTISVLWSTAINYDAGSIYLYGIK